MRYRVNTIATCSDKGDPVLLILFATVASLLADTEDLLDGELFSFVFVVDTGTFLNDGNGIQTEVFYSNKLCRTGNHVSNRTYSAQCPAARAFFKSSIMTSVSFICPGFLRFTARERPSYPQAGPIRLLSFENVRRLLFTGRKVLPSAQPWGIRR